MFTEFVVNSLGNLISRTLLYQKQMNAYTCTVYTGILHCSRLLTNNYLMFMQRLYILYELSYLPE